MSRNCAKRFVPRRRPCGDAALPVRRDSRRHCDPGHARRLDAASINLGMEIAAEIPNITGGRRSKRSRTALILICGVLPLLILRSTPVYAAAGDITTVI